MHTGCFSRQGRGGGAEESLSFRRSENDSESTSSNVHLRFGERTRGSHGGKKQKKKNMALSAFKSLRWERDRETERGELPFQFVRSFFARVSRIFVRTCGGKEEREKKKRNRIQIMSSRGLLECPWMNGTDLGRLETSWEFWLTDSQWLQASGTFQHFQDSKFSQLRIVSQGSLWISACLCTHVSRTRGRCEKISGLTKRSRGVIRVNSVNSVQCWLHAPEKGIFSASRPRRLAGNGVITHGSARVTLLERAIHSFAASRGLSLFFFLSLQCSVIIIVIIMFYGSFTVSIARLFIFLEDEQVKDRQVARC